MPFDPQTLGPFKPTDTIEGTIEVVGDVITFTSTMLLEANSRYVLILGEDIAALDGSTLGESLALEVTSLYDPAYCTLTAVKRELADIEADDDTIWRVIRDNSVLIKTTSPRSDTSTDNLNPIDWANPPVEVYEYIKYKSTYDIMMTIVNNRAIDSLGDTVALGDFRVQHSSKTPDMSTTLRILREKMAPWYDLVMGHKWRAHTQGPRTVVRGERVETIPTWATRTF